MDYFISDLHFGHRNIIRYCDRPFKTVYEMNETIIKNWNNVVTDNDRVFVVGDVFLCDIEEAKTYLARLNGHKICIKGNHDGGEKYMLGAGFDEFYYQLDYDMPDGRRALLQHYPTDQTLFLEKYDVLIHGHVHRGPSLRGKRINVSCEVWDYTPISVERLSSLETLSDEMSSIVDLQLSRDGELNLNLKIHTEDFSGVVEHIFKELKKYWGHE